MLEEGEKKMVHSPSKSRIVDKLFVRIVNCHIEPACDGGDFREVKDGAKADAEPADAVGVGGLVRVVDLLHTLPVIIGKHSVVEAYESRPLKRT